HNVVQSLLHDAIKMGFGVGIQTLFSKPSDAELGRNAVIVRPVIHVRFCSLWQANVVEERRPQLPGKEADLRIESQCRSLQLFQNSVKASFASVSISKRS